MLAQTADDGAPAVAESEGPAAGAPYVGMRLTRLDDDLLQAMGITDPAPDLVVGVAAGGPAERGGIRAGDLVISVGGEKVTDQRRAGSILAGATIGQSVAVVLQRNGQQVPISVVPRTAPTPSEAAKQFMSPVESSAPTQTDPGPDVPALGMTLRTLTQSWARQYGLGDQARGAVVSFVAPGSDAATQGLLIGDVIASVGNAPTATASEVASRLIASTSTGRPALVAIRRGRDQQAFIALRDLSRPVQAATAQTAQTATAAIAMPPAPTTQPVNGPRFALVIGNSSYGPALGSLANPLNDARLVARKLRAVGFNVELLENADQKAMKRAISNLGARMGAAGRGSTGLFYYAGHGMQSRGQNYLIPVGAVIEREADVDLEAVAADTVLAQMEEAGASTNIIILDACRNVPVLRSFRSGVRGLARMEAPNGSFISYSTAPGAVAYDGDGANSPFAQALAAEFERSGEPIELTFRNVRRSVLQATGGAQTPWDSSSLTDSFSFKP